MAEAEPPTKKAKATTNMDENAKNLDDFIEKVINSKKNLIAVMDDIYTKTLPVTNCYAGHVKDTKQLSHTIHLLNEKLPLKTLNHLKRVCKSCILICTKDHFSKTGYETIQDYLDTYIPELQHAFDYIKVVEVPAEAPVTKKQNLECRYKWATNFHPSTYYETLLSNSCFSIKELRFHRRYMGMAFEILKLHLSTTDPNVNLSDLNVNAAVVVDPHTKSVVAIALDKRNAHPTQHATMVAIDNVAKTQNGGAWDYNEEVTKETVLKIRKKFNDISFGARAYVSKKDETDIAKVDNSPYLCTGYDIYLVREPCIMCSMGLVHARIKRVFYTYDNVTLGALKSRTKLHCIKHLNHRFEVFTGFNN